MKTSEAAGGWTGVALAPVTGLVSALRRSRMFHPRGVIYRAQVWPREHEGALGKLAERLSGPALVRLSGAWWKTREWKDVLGLAVRFRHSEVVSEQPEPGDQDLLFATIRSPWTTVPAALTTEVHDFLQNDYYAVSPFEVEGLGRVRFRLVSSRVRCTGESREERLQRAVEIGAARFRLEVRRAALLAGWHELAELELEDKVGMDYRELKFWPFRNGRGIKPVGFVHAIRRATYASSQAARDPLHPGH